MNADAETRPYLCSSAFIRGQNPEGIWGQSSVMKDVRHRLRWHHSKQCSCRTFCSARVVHGCTQIITNDMNAEAETCPYPCSSAFICGQPQPGQNILLYGDARLHAAVCCRPVVNNDTTTSVRKPRGIVRIPGWLKGTIAAAASRP